jgi:hypothetical protein
MSRSRASLFACSTRSTSNTIPPTSAKNARMPSFPQPTRWQMRMRIVPSKRRFLSVREGSFGPIPRG